MSSNRPVVDNSKAAEEYFMFRYKTENNLHTDNIGIVSPHLQLKQIEAKALEFAATEKPTNAAQEFFAKKLMMQEGIVPPHFHKPALDKFEATALGNAKEAVESLRNNVEAKPAAKLS